MMRFRFGTDGPLGLFVALVSVPVICALGFLVWRGEISFFRNPSGEPLLLIWHQAMAVKLIFAGLALLCFFVLRWRGVSSPDDGDQSGKRYSDREDI